MEDKSTQQVTSKGQCKNSIAPGRRDIVVLVYRWLIFLSSVVLCVADSNQAGNRLAILETLAVAAVYNGAVTANSVRNRYKPSSWVLYPDILVITVLILFSGGIRSDLYIFLFFVLGFSGIFGEISHTMKAGVLSVILYTLACILAGRLFAADINIAVIAVQDLLLLMIVFAISGICYEIKKYDEQRKKEFRMARTDKLTGLANRHYFDQRLKEEVEYVLHKGAVLNILMFDLDNFKGFNDTYGHVSGDKLLILFSDIIRQCVRKSDIPVRYGGEEFMVIIRDMDIIIAKSVGERIRRQLEKQRIYIGHQDEKKKITVSCGVAQFPTHSCSIKEVIEKADEALYHAKEIGKNIVVSYDELDLSREAIENLPATKV